MSRADLLRSKEFLPSPMLCRYRIDCNSCMLVETGEKANYMGLLCGDCGRLPRSPYGYF